LSLTLREEHGLRLFKNRVLRRIFGWKKGDMMVGRENRIMKNFMICTLREVYLK
jgi:hypothetical protein